MRNKNNEPRSGCSMLIGCGSLAMISAVIFFILMASALSDYASEIYARSQNMEDYTAYVQSITPAIYSAVEGFYRNNYLNAMIYAAQIVVLFIVFKLIYKRPVSQMGLSGRHWAKFMGLGCLAGFAAISLYALIAYISGIAVFSDFTLSNLATVDMFTSFVFFIGVGFYEEILFRGFFMTILKTVRKKWVIIAVPAVIFGFMHLPNPNASFIGVVNVILIGLVFAYMFIRTGSLWMPIGYHIIWNFFQGNIYGIQVSGMDKMPALMKYAAAGPDILTGGEFGAEGGLICTAITLIILAYIRFSFNIKEPPEWALDGDLPFNTR